ncbi:TolC family protein [candidate division KSB1 bacterium]|nr:TolC family protein [candidate division KSB1 bacterium]
MAKQLSLFIIGLAALICAPAVTAQMATLDRYVREGLAGNLALQQQNFSYEKSAQALRQARGLFLPSLTLSARYSDLRGEVLNLGTLINPVYSTLNQLLQAPAFPTNIDLRLPLQREAKATLLQPLFHPEILYNYRIHAKRRDAEAAHRQAFKRQLVADIKTAYFNYAKTVQVVELYRQTLPLLEENLRVNERLRENQKVTADAVYRARAELSDIKQKLAEAGQQSDAAAQYFNFLLNRTLGTPIQLIPDSALAVEMAFSREAAQNKAKISREEFQQLRAGIGAAEAAVKVNTASFLPNLSLGVDYGFQGNKYDFGADQDYLVVSLVAQWNLFNSFQDVARRQQASLEVSRLQTQMAELENQIALQVRVAFNDAAVAKAAIATANDRLVSAQRSFELVAKKYAQGAAAQVEYIDARTAFTNAGINQILTAYEYYIKYAQFERAAGLYPMNERQSARH